jgi:general secretion pathway protein L
LLALDLPRGLRGEAREKVARRQVHDRLRLDPSGVEVRPYAPDGSDQHWTRVFIADRKLSEHWKTLTGRAVLPDYLSLPAAKGVWTIQVEAAAPKAQSGVDADGAQVPVVMVRLGPEDGFTTTSELASILIGRALADQGKPRAVLRLGAPLEGLDLWLADQGLPVLQSAEDIEGRGLPRPVVLEHGELTCDLRQDPQAARRRLKRQLVPWLWVLGAAAVAACIWSGAQIVALQRATSAQAAVAATNAELVRRHFVPAGPLLDARAQVSAALAERRASARRVQGRTDPVELAGRAAEVLARPDVTTMRMSYASGDDLRFVLQVANFAVADELVGALEDAGMRAALTDSRISEDGPGVQAEVSIQLSSEAQP